jgi:ferredoxin
MKRKDFIKTLSIFSITMPFLTSCGSDEDNPKDNKKKKIAPGGPYKVIDDLCTSCLKCFAVCPELDRDTITQEENTVKIHEHLCIECGECYVICPYDAIIHDDRKITKDDILHVVQKDCTGCKLCEGVCPTASIIVTNGKAEITQNTCVHCNKCLEVCPTETIVLGPLPEPKNHALDYHVKSTWCTGCQDCINACPEHAITMIDGKAVIDTELCTQCGECEPLCPEKAIYQGNKEPIKYFVSSCRGCGRCISSCPSDALHMVNGKAFIDQDKCTKCGECVSHCPWNLIVKL